MINYAEIIESIQINKVKQLLEQLGAETIIDKGTYLITNTICHNVEGGSLKLYYYDNNKIFYCYTNCEAMSIFSFLKHYYETRDIDYDWYKDIYLVVIDCSNFDPFHSFKIPKYKSKKDLYRKKEVAKLPTYPNGLMDYFTKFYPPEWLNDGITKETMDKFNIKMSIEQNKIIIPHYNSSGELVGIRGRALDEWEAENIGKYMPVRIGEKWYSHPLSLNLYGLNFNKNNIIKNKICYIFESEKSVMQLDNFSIDNCAVAVCGSQLNKWQIKELMRECHPSEIVICFDNEEVDNSFNYFNKLHKICEKYCNYSNMSFIYDMKHRLDLKDSPTDRGEEIFLELLKGRVKVNAN